MNTDAGHRQHQATHDQQEVSQVPGIGQRPRPHVRRFRDGALDLHDGDEKPEQDVLCQDRQAQAVRHCAAIHVAMIVGVPG
jgi:hypothetical protein